MRREDGSSSGCGSSTKKSDREAALGFVIPGYRLIGAGIVMPDAAQDAPRIARVLACAVAIEGAAGYALAILGNAVQPGTAADAIVEVLQDRQFAARVVVVPPRSPEHQINLGRCLHTDAANPAVIVQILRGAGLWRARFGLAGSLRGLVCLG